MFWCFISGQITTPFIYWCKMKTNTESLCFCKQDARMFSYLISPTRELAYLSRLLIIRNIPSATHSARATISPTTRLLNIIIYLIWRSIIDIKMSSFPLFDSFNDVRRIFLQTINITFSLGHQSRPPQKCRFLESKLFYFNKSSFKRHNSEL